MSSPNTTLNYVGFFMLYVICFVFMYKKMAGIIALGSLTIIHTAATLFIGNEVSNKLINGQLDGTSYHPFIIISLISILIASGLNAVGLILIMLMVIELQKKYNDTVGTPINLPPDRENDYNQFKLNMIIIFGIDRSRNRKNSSLSKKNWVMAALAPASNLRLSQSMSAMAWAASGCGSG